MAANKPKILIDNNECYSSGKEEGKKEKKKTT